MLIKKIFGNNVSQNISELRIKKTDLPYLTVSAANSPQALLVAVMLRGVFSLSGYIKVNDGILTANNKAIILGFPESNYNAFEWGGINVIKKGNLMYLRREIIIEVYKEYIND